MPDVYMLGGPNGAGKTTAARELIPNELALREFINADEIARGLSPFNPDGVALRAGRLMLERIAQLRQAGESFVFETTCAGREHARWLTSAKRDGWRITVIFLWLPSAELAEQRVAQRVREGGHAVPPEVIRRRYAAGLRNLVNLYLPLADLAAVYENAETRRLIARRIAGQLTIYDSGAWANIEGYR
jgi:predicted ABC-type ATPase